MKYEQSMVLMVLVSLDHAAAADLLINGNNIIWLQWTDLNSLV